MTTRERKRSLCGQTGEVGSTGHGVVSSITAFDLDCGIQVDAVEQPTRCHSVVSGYVSHRRTQASNDHLDYCLIVFKEVQQSVNGGKVLRSEWCDLYRSSKIHTT